MSAPILIFGSGSYVLDDAYGPQPVLRSVLQWARTRQRPVMLALRSAGKRADVLKRAAQAEADTGVSSLLSVVTLDEALAALKMKPLAAFVCTPDEAHADYLNRAANVSVPAFVVKPMTADLSSARMIAARKAAIWVDYHKRFDPSNLMLREAVLNTANGAPLAYQVQYTQPRRLPLDAFSWADGTDVFTYIGCHYADQLSFLFPGLKLRRVSATGIAGEVHRKLGGIAYDIVSAQLDCQRPDGGRLLATMHVGWNDPDGTPAKSHQRVELTMERARIIADQTERGFQMWDDSGTRQSNPYFFTARRDPVDGRRIFDGYGVESINRFLDWCASDDAQRKAVRASTLLPWAETTLFAEQALDSVRKSLKANGAWVDATP